MAYKRREKRRELANWALLSTQGKTVHSHINNTWLHKPRLLEPGQLTKALKTRANTTANRTALKRGRSWADLNCRKCRTSKETLGHILGLRVYTKAQRIRRHSEIRNLVLDIVGKRDNHAVVSRKPVIRSPSGENLKPDLVIKSQKRVYVVNVTVRHEDKDELAGGRESKLEKYAPVQNGSSYWRRRTNSGRN
jgi:hypothetical protein